MGRRPHRGPRVRHLTLRVMLISLAIRDIILIERLELEFERGLSALTGETGAGKSILLDALGLALGGRAERTLVRAGAAQGSVHAGFAVPDGPELPALLDGHGLVTASKSSRRCLTPASSAACSMPMGASKACWPRCVAPMPPGARPNESVPRSKSRSRVPRPTKLTGGIRWKISSSWRRRPVRRAPWPKPAPG